MIPLLKIIPFHLLKEYAASFDDTTKTIFEGLQDSELSIDNFSFYTSVSAVFSSKIEGEAIELDSFIKHKRLGVEYTPDYTQKIYDLYSEYEFAKNNRLTAETLMQAHRLLTRNILHARHQGQFRKSNMFVMTDDGRIEYVAAAPEIVLPEMDKFYDDLELLLKMELNFKEVLFFASMLHLVFIKIHPLDDGNGRTARLMEKWFLSEKIGSKAWFIQSEKHYYNHHQIYYANIRKLGLEYNELDYSQALPFLQMMPASIVNNK
jgi:Fic family protein